MASTRKKQDEKNLKVLRELVSLPPNKYCFDCNQRGPTYVNVTIGSFVCTKCSGMLRGLTPPHRVKSISMATFAPEEVDLLRNKGNNYCRQVWLGLFENSKVTDFRDEQQVRDFMVDKYERKRYYLEPSLALHDKVTNNKYPTQLVNKDPEVKLLSVLVAQPKSIRINGLIGDNSRLRNKNEKSNDFVADFVSADIYSASNAIQSTNNNTTQQFANFDNNPIFNTDVGDWTFSNYSALCNEVPIFPKCNGNSWSMPVTNNSLPQNSSICAQQAPSEDRYAALKDLDNALKVQPSLDWNSDSSSSLYSSATPTSSLYSSPSPQGSMYGSPSQGQIMNLFVQDDTAKASNPFNNTAWNNNTNQVAVSGTINPFRITDFAKVNGISHNVHGSAFSTVNSKPWIANANPFTLGTTSNGNGFSNNPFL